MYQSKLFVGCSLTVLMARVNPEETRKRRKGGRSGRGEGSLQYL